MWCHRLIKQWTIVIVFVVKLRCSGHLGLSHMNHSVCHCSTPGVTSTTESLLQAFWSRTCIILCFSLDSTAHGGSSKELLSQTVRISYRGQESHFSMYSPSVLKEVFNQKTLTMHFLKVVANLLLICCSFKCFRTKFRTSLWENKATLFDLRGNNFLLISVFFE